MRVKYRALVPQGTGGRHGIRGRGRRPGLVKAAGTASIADTRGHAVRLALLAQLHGHRKVGALSTGRDAPFDYTTGACHHALGAAVFIVRELRHRADGRNRVYAINFVR